MLDTKRGAALVARSRPSPAKGENMKIQIARPLAIGGVHHDVGEVVEVDDALGRQLMAMSKAKEPSAKPAKGKKSAKAN